MVQSTKEKLGIAAFGVFALLFLLLGFRQIGAHIAGPQRPAYAGPQPLVLDVPENFGSALDTDGDGLSDLEEQTLFDTSPYLEDSDSDGVPDGVEVDRNENPLCPSGQECVRGEFGTKPLQTDENLPQSGVVVSQSAGAITGDISPKEIRQLLIEAGATREQVDDIPDNKLLELYQETINEDEFSEQRKMLETFVSPKGSELRLLLTEQGVPESELDKLTDDQLIEMFQGAIQSGQ